MKNKNVVKPFQFRLCGVNITLHNYDSVSVMNKQVLLGRFILVYIFQNFARLPVFCFRDVVLVVSPHGPMLSIILLPGCHSSFAGTFLVGLRAYFGLRLVH
jgi:hypothetical protein